MQQTQHQQTTDELEAFCDDWLAAWTGNRPDNLAGFYDESVFYRDPLLRNGVAGKRKLEIYFRKLLGANPNWVWRREELIPTEAGFTLKWSARIPVAGTTLQETGLDIVEVAGGLIKRNEVYFDRSRWLALQASKP